MEVREGGNEESGLGKNGEGWGILDHAGGD